ncbi:head-tail connector protein [Sphingobium sp. V4]|uniref:head-tail connector protein n=1 Tax=Sphingobium sp. V4 TaxID=3038927 RepID=UPI00255829DE|nr:head-tail connector protein [Sphingobium sp. V4]WIW88966.1 head-tail connector protein [Sphingobium sp. V4]
MRVTVVIPPQPVVTWAEAKEHLRLDSDDEKVIVEAMIAAATEHLDGPSGYLGRALGLQTLEMFLPSFGVMSIAFPVLPAVDVVSVEYVDGNGETAILEAEDFELSGSLLRPTWPRSWPSAQWHGCDGEPVRIRYRAGYAVNPDADPVVSNIPAPIRAAILLMVGDLYRNRATVAVSNTYAVPMSTTVAALLQPYRVYR